MEKLKALGYIVGWEPVQTDTATTSIPLCKVEGNSFGNTLCYLQFKRKEKYNKANDVGQTRQSVLDSSNLNNNW